MTKDLQKTVKEKYPNGHTGLENQDVLNTIKLGSKAEVGAPSSAFYQYIFGSLMFENHSLIDLQELLQIRNRILEITGFLEMKNGELIAVAKTLGENDKTDKFNRLFISLRNALETKEILINSSVESKQNDNN